jgi:hypothetical protein
MFSLENLLISSFFRAPCTVFRVSCSVLRTPYFLFAHCIYCQLWQIINTKNHFYKSNSKKKFVNLQSKTF